ncbi:MAG: Rpn family recombination-promoting nuclease/putative transposase [Ruminococcus sp.]|jgi:predicted transposase/invertase (TIGR01784 family)|nr:Rpn family recombination-promoting nuclease/putative transposase [Ruminococcus sp.]
MDENTISLPEILPAYDDGIFKAIFTRPESEPALIDIIKTFTGIEVATVAIKNSERTVQNAEDKRIRFDILCTTESGEMIDIEMQASAMEGDKSENTHINIRERSVFYEAMLHSSQPRPKAYTDQCRSIQLMICNYSVFPDDNIIRRFYFTDEYGGVLSQSMGIIFVELSKLDYKKPVESMSDLEEWAFYLRYSDNPKYRTVIETLKNEKEVFRMAYETQEMVSQDLSERAYYMSRLKYELDMQHNETIWTRQGIQKGIQQGSKQTTIQIARNLLSNNAPIDLIMKSTGLSESELRSL